ncbi:MAG: YdcF family protein [Kiritimatiellaeota bacterium]|nr:YdcF family protein [Kiritimatiellota bacterium]
MRKFGIMGEWVRSLLVGPAGFVLLFLGTYLLVLYIRRRRTGCPMKVAARAGAAFCLVFLTLCLPYPGALLDLPLHHWARAMEREHPAPSGGLDTPAPRSVVLVLGGGVTDSGFPSSETLDRLERALEVWRRLPTAWFLLAEGGIGKYGTEERVRAYLERCGLPKDRILLETKSLTTQQNIKFCLPILRRHQISQIILVTNLRHMVRGRLVCRRYGLDPAVVASYAPPSLVFCPSWRGLFHFSASLNEYVGLLGYRLLGWI